VILLANSGDISNFKSQFEQLKNETPIPWTLLASKRARQRRN